MVTEYTSILKFQVTRNVVAHLGAGGIGALMGNILVRK